jgi:hypothetical protein
MLQKEHYDKLFSLDKQNRESVWEALSYRQKQLAGPENVDEEIASGHKGNTDIGQEFGFIDLVKPLKGSREETCKFMCEEFFRPLIDAQISGSVRVKNIFSSIAPNGNDANPRGVNGTIMAFIEFFDNHGYFERTHNGTQILYKDIIVSFLAFSKNKIGNLDGIIGRREEDVYYNIMLSKLKNRARSFRM